MQFDRCVITADWQRKVGCFLRFDQVLRGGKNDRLMLSGL